jgi:diacylglycerol kinase (ATP)
VFKILPEQEEAITISDLLFDGILVIECETPPTSPPIIVEEMSTLDQPNLVRRNMSYDEAMFSEPPQGSSGLMRPLEEDKEGSLSSSPHSPNASIGHEVDVDVCLLPGIIDDSPEEECEQVWSYKKIQKALFDAVKRGNLKKIEQLHKQGARLANVDEYGLSPLHHSARLGRKEVVQYIVKNIPKEALDLQDEDKAQTALHKAAWYGYTGICRILVEAGASLTRTDYQGNTPYYKSIESEDLELQKYLLKKQEERGYDCELEEVAV